MHVVRTKGVIRFGVAATMLTVRDTNRVACIARCALGRHEADGVESCDPATYHHMT